MTFPPGTRLAQLNGAGNPVRQVKVVGPGDAPGTVKVYAVNARQVRGSFAGGTNKRPYDLDASRLGPLDPPRHVRRAGSFPCRHCGADEAMPGHEC